MAWPLLLALVGAAASAAGNIQSQNAANRTLWDELERQRRFKQRSDAIYAESLRQSTVKHAEETIAKGQEQRATEYKSLGDVPLGETAVGAQPVMTIAQQKQAQARQALDAITQAKYSGRSLWDLDQYIKNIEATSKLGLESTLARQSADINPYEVQDAARKGNPLTTLGSVMQLASLVTGLGSLGGAQTITKPANFMQTLVPGQHTPLPMGYTAW
jgi:hypothetical protein